MLVKGLLISWLLVWPGHRQTWYWLYRITGSLYFIRKDCMRLRHLGTTVVKCTCMHDVFPRGTKKRQCDFWIPVISSWCWARRQINLRYLYSSRSLWDSLALRNLCHGPGQKFSTSYPFVCWLVLRKYSNTYIFSRLEWPSVWNLSA